MIFLTGSLVLQFSSPIWQTMLVGAIFSALGIALPRQSKAIFHRVEFALLRFAERKTLAIRVLFFAVIAIRLAALPLLPVPIPGIHDEFSYLLMADTFAHGRLANPTHPLWMSFETFHVNWSPTYSSMYPPAQGFVLALGQWLGHPWIGVLFSDAAMCAAILWMLQAWMPSRWAFLGGVLVALKFGIASYWMNSYWGGAVAAAGGALVLGALPRMVRRAHASDALLLGLGTAILANSRPYEGLLFCIPAAGWLLWWLLAKTKSKVSAWMHVRRFLAPLLFVWLLTAVFMLYYNWRLTGNALLLPHTLNVRTYHSAPMFIWDKPKPPLHYNNATFEDLYTYWEREEYHRTWADFAHVSWLKITRYSTTYFWSGLLLLLPALPWAFRGRKMKLASITFLFGLVATFTVIWSNSHYAAPFTCALFALLVQAIRYLRTFRLARRPIGLALSWAIVALLAIDTGSNVAQRICDPLQWACTGDVSRFAVIDKLSRLPGKHLVLVRYDEEEHNIHDDWVFNGADIDGAKILWARELGAAQNAKLFAYFKDRTIWLVTPDSDNTYLAPYSPPLIPKQ